MRPATIALVLLGLLAPSCSRSSLSRYYYLPPPTTAEAGSEGPALGVETVSLPAYLDRESTVTVVGPHELILSTDHVWAEPLDDSITRFVSEILATRLGSARVEVDAWPAGAVEYRVSIRVTRMLGELGGEAALDARWTIVPEVGESPAVEGRTALRRASGSDMASYAAALSAMLQEMSGQIADAFPVDR